MSYIPFFDTPDTFAYMVGGYVVFIVLPVLFIASLVYRYRSLKQDEMALDDVEKEKK